VKEEEEEWATEQRLPSFFSPATFSAYYLLLPSTSSGMKRPTTDMRWQHSILLRLPFPRTGMKTC